MPRAIRDRGQYPVRRPPDPALERGPGRRFEPLEPPTSSCPQPRPGRRPRPRTRQVPAADRDPQLPRPGGRAGLADRRVPTSEARRAVALRDRTGVWRARPRAHASRLPRGGGRAAQAPARGEDDLRRPRRRRREASNTDGASGQHRATPPPSGAAMSTRPWARECKTRIGPSSSGATLTELLRTATQTRSTDRQGQVGRPRAAERYTETALRQARRADRRPRGGRTPAR